MTTAPHAPVRWLPRLRPLVSAPERCLGGFGARRGLSSSPQLAPEAANPHLPPGAPRCWWARTATIAACCAARRTRGARTTYRAPKAHAPACARPSRDADGCLNVLRELDAELDYLARCQEAGATAKGDGPALRLVDGVRCEADALVDTAEVRELLLKAGTRFDELFDSVPQSELKLAMEAVRRSDSRRAFVKVG